MADRSTPAAPPLMQTHPQLHSPTSSPASAESGFWVGQRVHFTSQPRRTGAVKYVGPVQGYSGDWVGVDWDAPGEGKHDGSHNGVRYFTARGPYTASFVRPHNLSSGISLLEALKTRYRTATTKDEEDLKELDLSGNLLSDWQDVGIICQGLPALTDLNISSNSMSSNVTIMPQLSNICVLVLNHTGVLWEQVEILRDSIPHVAELHLMENNLKRITPLSSTFVQGFKSLKLLNLEHNCLSDWDEIVKLSQLPSLEQLYLNYNNLNHIWYPECEKLDEPSNEIESPGKSFRPFENLHGLSLGSNNIEDLGSVDSLNSFPNLMDVRLSDNPVADLGKGGVPRFVFIARLAKVKILNGSEVSPRERKDSEIRYIRLVMSKFHGSSADVLRLHPRFLELRQIHGIDDEKPSTGASGPQKLALTLISVSLKCTGASMGEKPLVVKKLPATTTVGKLKNLCESFFKLKSVKPVLFLQEEGAPLPALLEDDMASLVELGIGNDSTILVDERP
ncbi:tubulin-folding cofactor E isoform X2 [Andrographis paniculata]|uniref:tubulin-folding cofactor E isoform X2 n=1 Tax=Andrographis paniculata TaxID=175694 RepID=UPI0021E7898F|nr:tubulin-folding cofactor E isoform X2 [Andrographis paniculata]